MELCFGLHQRGGTQPHRAPHPCVFARICCRLLVVRVFQFVLHWFRVSLLVFWIVHVDDLPQNGGNLHARDSLSSFWNAIPSQAKCTHKFSPKIATFSVCLFLIEIFCTNTYLITIELHGTLMKEANVNTKLLKHSHSFYPHIVCIP